jgi:UDP-glucose 4-epimerase
MTVYVTTTSIPIGASESREPSSYYGISKYAAERYVHATAERTDLPFQFFVTSFRMFNVYGPGQGLDNPYQGVLRVFLGNLLRGEPIRIYGDGGQTRDFIYVEDVVDAWIRAIENSATFGAVLNLGSGEEISINQLADCAITALERSRDDHAACWDGRHKFRLMSVFNELLIGRSARIARNYIQI